MYGSYGKKAHFLVVYIREAHPTDGWRSRKNDREGIKFKQPKLFGEREKIAATCAAKLKVKMPVSIDGMDDYVEKCYKGWPDRLAVVAKGGKLVYYGGKGPRGFKPTEAESALKKLLTAKTSKKSNSLK